MNKRIKRKFDKARIRELINSVYDNKEYSIIVTRKNEHLISISGLMINDMRCVHKLGHGSFECGYFESDDLYLNTGLVEFDLKGYCKDKDVLIEKV